MTEQPRSQGVKVWIVTSGNYSDYHIVGVFGHQGTANVAATMVTDSQVTEWEVDSLALAVTRRLAGEKIFECAIDIKTGAMPWPAKEPPNLEDAAERMDGTLLTAKIWARDKEGAQKILAERRQAILRQWAEAGT